MKQIIYLSIIPVLCTFILSIQMIFCHHSTNNNIKNIQSSEFGPISEFHYINGFALRSLPLCYLVAFSSILYIAILLWFLLSNNNQS